MRRGVTGVIGLLLVAAVAWSVRPVAESPPAVDPYPSVEHWTGVRWERSRLDTTGLGQFAVFGVMPVGNELVAWGSRRTPGPDAGEIETAVVWTSGDGLKWSAHSPVMPAGQPYTISRMIHGPLGYLGFGYRLDGRGPSLVGSADGAAWLEIGLPAAGFEPATMAVAGNGFVLTGLLSNTLGAWLYEGSSWTELALPEVHGRIEQLSVWPTADGPIVTGSVIVGDDIEPLVIRWDGRSWARVGGDGPSPVNPDHGASIELAIPFRAGVYAEGSAGPISACLLGAAHIASINGPNPRTADIGDCASMPFASWVLDGDGDWVEVEQPRLPGATVSAHDVIAGGAGLIAIAGETLANGAPSNGLWTSADGGAWRRIGDAPMAGVGALLGFTVLPGRVVIVGVDELGAPTAWTGVPTP